jgi:hypothetical protein
MLARAGAVMLITGPFDTTGDGEGEGAGLVVTPLVTVPVPLLAVEPGVVRAGGFVVEAVLVEAGVAVEAFPPEPCEPPPELQPIPVAAMSRPASGQRSERAMWSCLHRARGTPTLFVSSRFVDGLL